MKKSIVFVIVLAIIIVILVLFLLLPKNSQVTVQNSATTTINGIEVFSPKPDEQIVSPLKITGKVNGGGWIGFEGQVGTVKLLDNDGKVLATGILTAQGGWMQQEINFETKLNFKSLKNSYGSLVFYNENPSGDSQKDKTLSLSVNLR